MSRKRKTQRNRRQPKKLAKRQSTPQRSAGVSTRHVVLIGSLALIALGIYSLYAGVPISFSNRSSTDDETKHSGARVTTAERRASDTPVRYQSPPAKQVYTEMEMSEGPRIFHWFGGVPNEVRFKRLDAGDQSNVRRADYAGAEACKECHEKNYNLWSENPHRWMNAWATDETVRGDFSGAVMHYMGGVATFYKDNSLNRMSLQRDGVQRTYSITRTIGSRFFQYYVGKLLDGPEAEDHVVRRVEHLLPFGYWFAQSEWVPVVNIEAESPDEERVDPFAGPVVYQYDRDCSECHTTRPTGDVLMSIEMMHRFDAYSPRIIHFSAEEYLRSEHPELLSPLTAHSRLTRKQMYDTLSQVRELPADSHAVNLGISCEACHNGCAAHVANENERPAFFPVGAAVHLEAGDKQFVLNRNSVNSNWVCSRCHAGNRERYAAGISTWNSTEYSDATRGGCYDPNAAHNLGMEHLTCVRCHNPHKAIGQQWPQTTEEDDASCLSCHTNLRQLEARAAHTHHPAGSSGDRCMNCHMPRINEGLQDVVRTHTIFSPTEPRMIEANHPNACNLCHVDRSIDWTLGYLKDWYQADGYSAAKIIANYPQRDEPVAIGWLNSSHHGTRLVAADALIRADAKWAIGGLLNVLDDPYLVNRQFTARGLGKMYGIDLRDHGYRFYMQEHERAEPLQKIREITAGK